MSDLVSRLLEAIEAKERRAGIAHPGPWKIHRDNEGTWINYGDEGRIAGKVFAGVDARFIVDNAPSSVLRRCGADRRTVMDWLATTRDPYEGMGDDELHQNCAHPAYEYARTEGQRKAWPYVDDPPEEDAGWELNITTRNPDAFERFDYTEERYWRRVRPDGPRQREVPVPFYIRNLALGYGITEEET